MTATTTPAVKPESKIETLKRVLNAPSVLQQFQNSLKENSGAFVASIIDLYNNDTRLQQCNPNSVVFEALKAASLKLPINKSLGFAWIIPYNNSVKTPQGWTKEMQPNFQIGYKGYIQLALRTGQYRFINADMVYEGELQTVNKLTGEVDFSGKKTSDKIVGYFAYIELLNGFSKTLYMSMERVMAHGKKYSPSFGDEKSRWKTDLDDMALKTVLKGLISRYGYMSVEMMTAFDSDNEPDYDGTEEIKQRANTKEISIHEYPVTPEDAFVVTDDTQAEYKTKEEPKPDF
jgi:recombination protein RecT